MLPVGGHSRSLIITNQEDAVRSLPLAAWWRTIRYARPGGWRCRHPRVVADGGVHALTPHYRCADPRCAKPLV